MPRPLIVLVEPKRNIQRFLLRAIEGVDRAAELVAFNTSEAALDYFLGYSSPESWCGWRQPNLLLLDLDLPRINGQTLLRQLRWMDQHHLSVLPPVVAFASKDDPQVVQAAFRHGASGVLLKTATPSRLVSDLHDTLRYWLQATLLPPAAEPATIEPRSKRRSMRESRFDLVSGAHGR